MSSIFQILPANSKEDYRHTFIEKIDINLYRINEKNYNLTKEELGKGGFAKVMKGRCMYNNQMIPAAIKLFENSNPLPYKKEDEFIEEIVKMCAFCHPNIVKIFGGTDIPEYRIIMEFLPLSLEKLLEQNETTNTLTGETKYELCEGIAAGLAHLHQLNIIHRDLKSSNILIEKDGLKLIPKISDFGSAGRLPSNLDECKYGKTIKNCAPELEDAGTEKKSFKPNKETDIYELGLVFGAILHSKNPPNNK